MSTPKERPIIMSGESIRAILAGTKTQTRRVIKPQPPTTHRSWNNHGDDDLFFWTDHPTQGEKGDVVHRRCPYGARGDRLWVREAWAKWDGGLAYLANTLNRDGKEDEDSKRCRLDYGVKWRPSIFMPREFSRIALEITGIRVERVKEISWSDAIAEGITNRDLCKHCDSAQMAFRELWDSINAARGYGWDSNPWVFVVEFRRVAHE